MSGGHKVIVCGSRHWRNHSVVERVLSELPPGTTVIHGAQVSRDPDRRLLYGADYIAGEVAKRLGLTVIEYPADWKRHGKAAGPIRNQQMFDEHPDVRECIAFRAVSLHTGRPYVARGTVNCTNVAHTRGVPVRVVYDEFWID